MWFHESVGLPKIYIWVSTLLASLLLVSAAAAETVVPPGNGAATQYTEGFPTSSGNAVSGNGINGGGRRSSPSHVLGHSNAEKLEGEGQVGKETARVAAETAPSRAGPSPAPASRRSGGSPQDTAGGGNAGQVAANDGGDSGVQTQSLVQHTGRSAESGDGSSGLGEVIGQATGSSSGESGLLLPLVLLAAVVGAFAYAWRRRRVAH